REIAGDVESLFASGDVPDSYPAQLTRRQEFAVRGKREKIPAPPEETRWSAPIACKVEGQPFLPRRGVPQPNFAGAARSQNTSVGRKDGVASGHGGEYLPGGDFYQG